MSNTISTHPPLPPRPAIEMPAPGPGVVETVRSPNLTAVKPERALSAEEGRSELKRALKELNEQSRKEGRKLNFSIDDEVNRVVITVRQTETGEVIRQIPSEAVLRLAHNLKAIRGLLYNETT